MLTGVRVTLVDFLFAACSFIAGRAMADKPRHFVLAGSPILTRMTTTFVNISLTSLAVPAVGAAAHVVIYNIRALSTVFTGIVEALVDVFFAKSASISRQTLTSKTVNFVDT